MLTILAIDVEDYVSPATEGIDEIAKQMAEALIQQDITGSFFMLVEKARSLQSRGRADVLTALSHHDIGSHTTPGSLHPTIPERLVDMDWTEGVDAMRQLESQGFTFLETVFEKQMRSLSRHGGSFAPQLVAALGKMRKAYVFSPASLPGHNLVWYCGALNLGGDQGLSGFEDVYYNNATFARTIRQITHEAELLAKTWDYQATFIGHPTRLRATDFWDKIYYGGANPTPGTPWAVSPMRSRSSVDTAMNNVRRHLEIWRKLPFMEVTSVNHIVQRFGRQRENIDVKDINEIVQRVLRTGKPVHTEFFSPAECVDILARAVISRHKLGLIPNHLSRRDVLGPVTPVPSYPKGAKSLSLPELVELARGCERGAARGMLSGQYQVGDATIGLGTALMTLALALQGPLRGVDLPQSIKLSPAAEVPDAGDAIRANVLKYGEWPVLPKGFNMESIAELARLQSWSMKPAYDWTKSQPGRHATERRKRPPSSHKIPKIR